MLYVAYFSISLAALAGLCTILYRTGTLLGGCPRVGAQARPAVIVVVTGFAVIGAGAVAICGALLSLVNDYVTLSLVVGVALIVLGLGFRHAAETLRRVMPTPLPTPEDRRRALKLSNL